MKRIDNRLLGAVALVFTAIALGATVAPGDAAAFHERKEVAGLLVVFGAEPEPALTDEIQFLVWRMSDLATEAAYTELTDAQVTVTRDGEEFGPFTLRPVRGEAGQYRTRHIFTEPGEYGTLLTFRKGEAEEVHSVDFGFRINDRAEMEIPKRRGGD